MEGKMIKPIATITLNVELTLTESEAAALNALTEYGIAPFLKVFYEKLGKAALEPHENGIRDLFIKISTVFPTALSDVVKARNFLKDPKGKSFL